MCGIVGGIAQRDVAAILLEGLRRLEYRGYDSAGMAVLAAPGQLGRIRALGKVQRLAEAMEQYPLSGTLGIAHTRWATHGEPAERNAHPHVCRDRCALVHNGIIENHSHLRQAQEANGHVFTSETDSEVIAHAVYDQLTQGKSLLAAVKATVATLEGAYALGVIDAQDTDHLVAARQGSPLVIGLGFGENFIASDVFALLPVTQRFLFLEEGDLAEIRRDQVRVFDRDGQPVTRPVRESALSADAVKRGEYRHYMQKEIFEQPRALADTLEGRLSGDHVLPEAFGQKAPDILKEIRAVQIVACGTSYHAGLVARHWIESITPLGCQVEVASEYRYRRHVAPDHALFVAISQSGETADTLAALRLAKRLGYAATLTICNVPESSLVAGVRPHPAHPRRTRDRRRLDQGLHHPTDRPAPPNCGAWPLRRPHRHHRGRARRLTARPAGPGPGLSCPGRPRGPRRRAIRRQTSCSLPGPWRPVPHRLGGRPQAQGDLLHSRRGLSRR